MKKKVFSLALVVCCLSVFIASSTMAYFTKEDTATNVITTGKIDIDLLEIKVDPESGKEVIVAKGPEDGFTVKDVMPGQEVVKVVYVKNEQYAEDAWVRVNITKSIVLADGKEGDPNLLEIEFNTKDWTAQADETGTVWYYYNKPLAAEEETAPLMGSVIFSAKAGNEYQEAESEIIVLAQAVQVKNNGETALQAQGWPIVVGEE
ncbi:MAG: SipW-dependent-type signal peptide-containing protein [Oscillospiraceae bacterium]|nr:SipW-dependent-type signal peptide-containing protein [Oscillospiraceae bacterium]